MRLEWSSEADFSFLHVPSWTEAGFIHGFADASTPDIEAELLRSRVESLFPGQSVPIRRLKQVHEATIVHADAPDEEPVGDGWFLDSRETPTALLIRTADCLPVIVYSRAERSGAILHCGWRSIIAGIASEAVRALDVAPAQLEIAIGPGIGVANYEVSGDVTREFLNRARQLQISTSDEFFESGHEGRVRLNLSRFLRLEFSSLGVRPERVVDAGICTFEEIRFFSHRRQGTKRARQVSFAIT